MFVTNDEELYQRAKHYGTFCRNDGIQYLWSDDVGYNYRISNVTAALILSFHRRRGQYPPLIESEPWAAPTPAGHTGQSSVLNEPARRAAFCAWTGSPGGSGCSSQAFV